MKRWIWMVPGLLLLWCSGCAAETDGTPAVKMDDLMQISTWVMDPALEGKGYWAYSGYTEPGCWVPAEGEAEVEDKEVFREERLLPGEPRIMAPLGYEGWNLNFTIAFDGIVTVEKTDPADSSILISFQPTLNDQWSGETVVTRNGPCSLNVYPVGKILEGRSGLLIQRSTIAEKEYFLTVKGYELDGSLMVTAELKLTTLEDEAYPYEEIWQERLTNHDGELFARDDNRTRFCAVELVSYEYSDHYKMMEMFG